MSRARDLGSFINSSSAGKNFIINGGMDISQKGDSLTGVNGYCLDRWFLNGFGTSSNISVNKLLILGGIPDFRYYMRIAPTTSSGQNFWLNQTIETNQVIKLAGKTVTLSFWYRVSSAFTQQWSASVVHSTAIDTNLNYPTASTLIFAENLTNAGSWQKYTKTFVVPSSANSLSVQLTSTNNVLSTAMFDLTGVQLEIGSSATLFSLSGGDIQGELAKCQRYYQVSTGITYIPFSFSSVYRYSVQFPVSMRVAPTVSVTGYAGGGGQIVGEFISTSGFQTGANNPTSGPYFTQYTASSEL
jgi:hypothetical protein